MAKDLGEVLLKDIVPYSIANDINIQSMCEALDPPLRAVAAATNLTLLLSRIDNLSEEMLDMLAWQYHVDIYEPEALPVEQKRAIVKNALLVHRYKGTRWAIRQTLLDLGFSDVYFFEWWEMKTAPHTFALKVYPLNEALMPKVRRAVYAAKPVRSYMTGLTARILHEEEITAAELAAIQRTQLFGEEYPWTEINYGNHLTSLKYRMVNDPIAARYSIYEKAEYVTMKIRICITEHMFVMYKYGDVVEPGQYYDGAIDYGSEAELIESVKIDAVKLDAHADAIDTTEQFKVTVKWIII